MYSDVRRRLASLVSTSDASVLAERRIGLEKESLRVTADGAIAQSDHPRALGCALTHPSITTDFSEALLEMVTPPLGSADEAIAFLQAIHQFILPRLPEGEHLWNTSMPCILRGAESIRIADFGESHTGQMKRIYRRGLGVRYGRRMQAIAGIHFNFSLPDSAWLAWHDLQRGLSPAGGGAEPQTLSQEAVSFGYFSTMQNLLRVGWVVPYLFGASPAICQSFLADDDKTDLETFNETTRYAPWGTSLRMGNIGYRYREDRPIDLTVRHHSLASYIEDVLSHVSEVHPPYERIGVRDAEGQYQQLNACRLQIENEYYSTVRPKQIPERGEMPLLALRERGIRYLELRSLDLDLLEPVGLNHSQVLFLELLMLFAWLGEARPLDVEPLKACTRNLKKVAHRGREPDLQLETPAGEVGLKEWGLAIMEAIRPIAEWLDEGSGRTAYTEALERQTAKFHDTSLTPSSRILSGVFDAGSFFDYAEEKSWEQHEHLRALSIDSRLEARLQQAVNRSIDDQARLEADSHGNLQAFLDDYFSQLDAVLPVPVLEADA